MQMEPIGLSDLALYIPELSISMETLVRQRVQEDPQLERHLTRAVKSTGQRAMRFPHPWEDTVTMAAQACKSLLEQNPSLSPQDVRFLALGTETSVDMSKAGSSYVLGLLEKASHPLPSSISTFQLQHACAAGALSMLTVAGFIQAAGRNGDTGIILTSDIARYKTHSTAEITQGAGATALLIQRHPRLIELDLQATGFYSKDVDDFFRPLGSVTAEVRGSFSALCYNEALIGAFDDHCRRMDVSPAEELASIDIFALHVPFATMPLTAMEKLLHKHLGFTTEESHRFLEERGFFASLDPTSDIGNIYTGSLFLGLAFSLKERWAKWKDAIRGKKVLLASYGSGNTMAVITGRIADRAPEVIAGWDLEKVAGKGREASFAQYENWLSSEKTPANYQQMIGEDQPADHLFYLANLREDGYREYKLR